MDSEPIRDWKEGSGQLTKPDGPTNRSNLIWWGLLLIVFALAITYSLVQPLGVSPDEAAHMKYVKFIASEGRLPVWEYVGGGEGGYEAQHPPLYYVLGAVVYSATSHLPENWRWQAMRWYSLLVGLVLLFVARGFALEYFRGRAPAAMFAFAAVGFTPLLLEYMTYINPDIMSVMWCGVILWMCVRVARGEAVIKDRVVLAIALGLGLLTKLTVLGTIPIILIAHLIEPHPDFQRPWLRRLLCLASTFIGSALPCAWWFIHNQALYGSAFIHTQGQVGSGLGLAAATGMGPHLLRLTLSNTYITTWVERAWMPPGAIGQLLYALISIIIMVALIGGVLRAMRRSAGEAKDPAPMLCLVFLLSLIAFHQAQVWFVDYEFNAGGRYLLNAILAIQALIIGSLWRLRYNRYWALAWVLLLVAVNIVSIAYMLAHVNPSAVPGWHVMQLTVPYK